MTIGITKRSTFREDAVSVSVTAYGSDMDDPSPELVGCAAGMAYAAAEAGLEADPYGRVETSLLRLSAFPGRRGTAEVRVHFLISSEDVLAFGPMHRARRAEVGRRMHERLGELFQSYQVGRQGPG